MVKVSVVVPVYNGEKYLRMCLDSICGQTLRDIEIICVDDGSTDSSWDILEEYKEKDGRIQIYRQKNKYAGAARNLGKSYAAGEYLVFWDCDDFFDLQALEKLYDRAKSVDADVCVCGGNQYIESKKKVYPWPERLRMSRVPEEKVFNRFTNPEHYLDFTNEAAWNKIFKREYIERIGLDFQTTRNGNDVYFTLNALGLADRITVLNEGLVNYRVDSSDSLVSSVSKAPLSPIRAWVDTAENLAKYDGFGVRAFANKALGSMVYMLSNLQEWKAFCQAMEALKEYGLTGMYILPGDEEYYYTPWRSECVRRLYQDTPEEFLVFLSHSLYDQKIMAIAEKREMKRRMSELKKKNKVLRRKNTLLVQKNADFERALGETDKELTAIKKSWSYKTGRALMWLPGKIRRIFG